MGKEEVKGRQERRSGKWSGRRREMERDDRQGKGDRQKRGREKGGGGGRKRGDRDLL